MNDYLNKELGNTTPVDYIVTSDTDSLFIQCKDLLKARHPDIDFSNRRSRLRCIFEKHLNELVDIRYVLFLSEFLNQP